MKLKLIKNLLTLSKAKLFGAHERLRRRHGWEQIEVLLEYKAILSEYLTFENKIAGRQHFQERLPLLDNYFEH